MDRPFNTMITDRIKKTYFLTFGRVIGRTKERNKRERRRSFDD